MKPLYEIVDLGVDHPDYFQGFGTSFTKFEYSTYGIGDTAEDAYQDALEQIASSSIPHHNALAALPKHCPFGGSVPEDADGECYYHVGIRWNEEG